MATAKSPTMILYATGAVSPWLRGYEAHVMGVKRGYVGQAIDKHHCAPSCMLPEGRRVPDGLMEAVSI